MVTHLYAILKSLYLNVFHVICVADLLHDCAMKVKSRFKNFDQLIAKVTSATAKNKTRQACLSMLFPDGQRWLNAALYFAKNLPEMKATVKSFEVSVILLTPAKVVSQTTSLTTQLFKIKDHYKCLVETEFDFGSELEFQVIGDHIFPHKTILHQNTGHSGKG